MNLQEQLMEDMKQAMRDKNMLKLGVIRLLRSEIKNFEIDNGPQDDAGVQKVIASQVKKMKDALVEFKNAGRDDIVADEEAKLVIMEAYLPQQLSDEELETIVTRVVAAAEDKNMGKLIGAVMKEVAGKADGNRVSALVRSKLQ
ncbi:MAG: aspartyl-tRNA amidotransferase subunit B [Patescibacteria group bacterium]|nr:MAG: aspartyl-tRNA amidotransferase subunit B [Patescibacteria group bacterium]